MLPVCPALTVVILCQLLYIELFEIYKKIPLFYCICTISTAYSTISGFDLLFFPLQNTWLTCFHPQERKSWFKLLSTIDNLSVSSIRSCRTVSCFGLVGGAGHGEQPIILEQIGEGCAGMAQRAPSCPRKHGLVEDSQEAGREGGGLRHLLTWQVGPGLFLVQGHCLFILLTRGFPITATTAGSIYKMVLHSPSNLFYIILIAVDLVYVYVPVFFQRFLKWLLNTYMM